jgi:hypothetical protein
MKLGLALMLALARAAAAADAKPPAPPECAPHDDPKLCGQVVKILFDLDALWSKPY